jgi:hypothetical protein
MTVSNRTIIIAVAALVTFGCSGQSQSRPGQSTPEPESAAASPPAQAPSTPLSHDTATSTAAGNTDWVSLDSAGSTMTLSLETRPGGSAPSALINGYRNGGVRVVVPLRWTVKWNWRNADPTTPHSLVVMAQREKIPLEGGRAAFSNAMSRLVTEGLPPGQTDQTTFEAEEAGWYWLLCGVPNHALNGEWLELRVDPEAKTAKAVPKS